MTLVDVFSDNFWDDREREIQQNTDIEVIWDKARLDAGEVASRKLLTGEAIEALEIAQMTANNLGIDWDTKGTYRDEEGYLVGISTIINLNANMIDSMIEAVNASSEFRVEGEQ